MAKRTPKTLMTRTIAQRIANEQGWKSYPIEGLPNGMTYHRPLQDEVMSLNRRAFLIAFYLGADVTAPECYCYHGIVIGPMFTEETIAEQYRLAAIDLKAYYDKNHGN